MLRIEYFDKERFMRQLSASHGSVLLHLDNGKTCDLKQDATARSMLQMMDTAPKKGFDLTVTDPADVTFQPMSRPLLEPYRCTPLSHYLYL